jgi:chaperonin GroEL (HSP60 family)
VKLLDVIDAADYADDDERLGGQIVREAVHYPVRQIANNA